MNTVAELTALQVAIVSDSRRQRILLREGLERHGVGVWILKRLDEDGLAELRAQTVDVVLCDLDDAGSYDFEFPERLIALAPAPVVFHDRTTMLLPRFDPQWDTHLVARLRERVPGQAAAIAPVDPHSMGDAATTQIAKRVWVLGASLGGPRALQEFLGALPAELPVAFVIAQHIGERHVPLLADQLDRAGAFEVRPAAPGAVLRHGQAVIALIDRELTVDSEGEILLPPTTVPTRYRPSIDRVMANLARRYGRFGGAIVFSGMGNDGAQGAIDVAANGGLVWAQDAASCVMSSMPDSARATEMVSYSGSPRQLAARLQELLLDRPPKTEAALHPASAEFESVRGIA